MSELATQSLTALAVLGLLAALLWWLRARGMAHPVRRRASRRLEVLERLPLSAQHSLHLVKAEGRLLLVGISPAGCSLVAECPPEERS